ncbi:flagellar biosynthetic protein FliR [Xylophilus rhododendri]|uniref:Flagellar biosynthetic protein FliR n=1 Tax=Xylophilus rhododendri TaxID=2697032 RepID=A0A857J2G4_9BURK|nr:flagellar biosynthetic protein FliR [Xylophilus rhododendri]QHI97936.1 flagellar biosynthetic protein FliR [Xylophilus rhododendri]
MISFSEAQIAAWLSPILWPFLRVLGMFSVAPIFSMRSIPVRAKVGLALLIAIAAQPSLTGQPIIDVNSPGAMGAVVQQVGVGMAIGFAVRLVFSAVELAGELIGLQMGLNFASFFNPASGGQASAVSAFFGQISLLLFIVVNGHLTLVMAVVRSFRTFPADGNILEVLAKIQLYQLGTELFASALWIALPMIALLVFTSLALGIISRVAPQMNIYAIGFPITLSVGMVGIAATLPMLDTPLLALMEKVIDLFIR